MNVDRERFLLLVGALSACHEPNRPVAKVSVAPTAVVVPTAASSSPRPTPPLAFCEALSIENQRILKSPTRQCPDGAKAAAERLVEAGKQALFRYCKEARGGTWAVMIESAALTNPAMESGSPCGASAHYRIVFESTAGQRAVSKDRQWSYFNDETDNASVETQFDYDGDGRNEIVVSNEAWANGGGRGGSLEVLRASGTAVEPYPVGFRYDAWLDADGDGRPDLVDGRFFSSEPACYGLVPIPLDGVPLLVHSRPDGTFSMSDDVARRWARAKCPALPASKPTVDAESASCERLWGRPIKRITAMLSTLPNCKGASDAEMVERLVNARLPMQPLNVDTPDPLPSRERDGG